MLLGLYVDAPLDKTPSMRYILFALDRPMLAAARGGLPMFKVPVLFRDEQVSYPKVYSPSPRKPGEVITDWNSSLVGKFEVKTFDPVTREDFYRVHDRQFVDNILDCKTRNGFGTNDRDVAESLPYTSGSFYAACVEALNNGKVACSPTSGFHHAEYASAQGFCTFNGLMVAAQKLRLEQPDLRIGVLDLDEHYGNGTDNIIGRFNLHDPTPHWTLGASSVSSENAEDFINNGLVGILKYMKSQKIDLLMYQAGADCHIDDPLGGRFTDDQLRRRDRTVFEICKKLGIPVAWNFAGGYQKDPETESIEAVLRIHRATMEECAAVYGK